VKLIQFPHDFDLSHMFKIMPILSTKFQWILRSADWQVNCPFIIVRDSVTHLKDVLSEKSNNHRVKALIVDDEKDICFLLGSILKQKNIDSSQANTLLEAEKIIENEAPPVIFLDNHLPDGLGINSIKRIKSKSPQSTIVMITAHDNASERKEALEKGADYFIAKPFTKELIFNTLAKIV